MVDQQAKGDHHGDDEQCDKGRAIHAGLPECGPDSPRSKKEATATAIRVDDAHFPLSRMEMQENFLIFNEK
jgi:hypothetical protein